MNGVGFRRMVLCAAVFAAAGTLRADFEVYFMRHGETPWNRARVLQGSIAFPDITAVGVGMAEDSAAEFSRRGIAFDRVYTSPYRRAEHTAEIIAAAQSLKAVPDRRIREQNCGSAEGKRYGDPAALGALLASATGVEPVEAVGDRVMDFFEKELAPLDGRVKRVLCVGHTLLLNVIEARLAGRREAAKSMMPNCCVHVIVYRGGRFSMKERAKVFYDEAKYSGRSRIRFVAHRGAGDLEMPEASRPAYADAVARQSDIVKLDLQKTRDGVIVMGHDPTLGRNMGWDVKIADLDYREILGKGRFKPAGGCEGERIVRLDEALAIVKTVPEFWIDFKHFDPAFAESALAEFVKAGIDRSRVMVATFSARALAYFQENHPEIRRVGHISSKTAADPGLKDQAFGHIGRYGLWGVNMPVLKGQTTPEVIAALKEKGVWVSLWFVQNEEKAAEFRASGCDAFVTDFVSKARRGVSR